jgi:hypothetical protein
MSVIFHLRFSLKTLQDSYKLKNVTIASKVIHLPQATELAEQKRQQFREEVTQK